MSRMLSQRAMSTRSLNAAITHAASGRPSALEEAQSPHRLKTGSYDHPHRHSERHSLTTRQVEEIVGRAEARICEQMREETRNAVKEILAALPLAAAATPAGGGGQTD